MSSRLSVETVRTRSSRISVVMADGPSSWRSRIVRREIDQRPHPAFGHLLPQAGEGENWIAWGEGQCRFPSPRKRQKGDYWDGVYLFGGHGCRSCSNFPLLPLAGEGGRTPDEGVSMKRWQRAASSPNA